METLNYILESIPFLLKGLGVTLQVAILSVVLGLIIGLVLGMFHISNIRILRYIAIFYLDIVRGTPLLVQILFIYFGIPSVTGITLSPFLAGVIAITINAGAYLVEIFRAGINAIDKGQMEAGRSLGFSNLHTMYLIILPQAVRHMIPAFVNQFIITLKDTSLLSVIGIAELTMTGQSIYAMSFRAFEILFAVGILYYIVIYSLTLFSRWLERRLIIK